jgi:predicted ATP-grasp superfamily ATP-dependent carboligase
MYYTGLGIARNLGRYGIPVVGISHQPGAPGSVSRYCRALVGPDSQEEPEALLKFLIDLGKADDRRGILFPTRDGDVLFLDRYREALEPYFAIPQPSHDVLELIMNKDRLARKAESLGIDSPRTVRIAATADLEKRRDEIVLPAVVKPVYAYQWRHPRIWEAVGKRKGIKVETFRELSDVYGRIARYQAEVLVQEWIPGQEDEFFVVGAYLNSRSECLGAFTAQKMLQFPPDFGLGCVVRSVRNDEVRALGVRLLEQLRFTGIAEVEFKRDSRTGRYRLIEVNPRHWDQHALGTACGVNLTYLAYRDHCGPSDDRPPVPSGEECRWVSGQGVVGNLKEDLRRGKVNLSLLGACIPIGRKVYALWDWRDPRPFWKVAAGRLARGRRTPG